MRRPLSYSSAGDRGRVEGRLCSNMYHNRIECMNIYIYIYFIFRVHNSRNHTALQCAKFCLARSLVEYNLQDLHSEDLV